MARPKATELTERELEIMQVVWSAGEQTIGQIRDSLAAQGHDRAYTTVATLVRILHEKGFLEQTTDVRPFSYSATRSEEDVSRRLLDDLLERVFGGSRSELLVRLFQRRKLTAKERAVLEALLKEKSR